MATSADFSPIEKKIIPVAKNFEDDAGMVSSWFLFYLDPLFEKGAKTPLELNDLGATAEQDKCDRLYEDFEKNWKYEVANYEYSKRSIWRPLWSTVGYSKLAKALFLHALYSGASFGPILILNQLVQHFDGEITLSTVTLSVFVALIFILPVFGSIVTAQSNIILAHVGLAFRNILINKIYRKSLNLSNASRQTSSTGQIINMFSADSQQIQRFMFFLNNVFLAPVTIGVCLYLIYRLVGPATFAGLGLIIVVLPFNGIIFDLLGKIRKRKMVLADARVKMMNEMLTGIRVIKFYAWEQFFTTKVNEIRHEELMELKKLAYITAVAFSLILMAVPIFLPVVIFFTYAKLGNNLTSATAFTTIALFNLMQFPFVFLPLGLSQYSQSLVASKRIMDFFICEELVSYIEDSNKSSSDGNDIVVSMENARLCWVVDDGDKEANADAEKASVQEKGSSTARSGSGDNEYSQVGAGEADVDIQEGESKENSDDTKGIELIAKKDGGGDGGDEGTGEDKKARDDANGKDSLNRSCNTIIDFNLQIKKGSLVAVVGAVGSGKSSMLSALLGEMHLQEGKVGLQGSVAYCDQRAWILNDSLVNNITFGNEYDEKKFDEVVYAVSLDDDINILPGGLQTQIGEKGINLSGGQKARVALARAVYRDADVYLLDDPLSAVDAHVGQFLFHECIKTTLKDKTRILVTHQVHLLPYMDQIVIIKDGAIAASGTYDDIMASDIDLENLLPQSMVKSSSEVSLVETSAIPRLASTTTLQMNQMNFDEGEKPKPTLGRFDSSKNPVNAAPAGEGGQSGKDASDEDWWKNSRKIYRQQSEASAKARKMDSRSSTLTSVEEKATGDVKLEAYTFYVRQGGVGLASGLLVSMVLAQAFQLGSLFWLQHWGAVSVDREQDGDPLNSADNIGFLQIFAAFSSASLLFYVARSLFLADHRVGTSKKLHEVLLDGTLRSPVSFFDVTPVGRMLNRFSADLVVVDEELSQTISQITNSFMGVLGALVAIAAATLGTFLILVIPLYFIYNRIQNFFRRTNTAISRLESVSRSPIYAGFSEALSGVNSVRAYGVQDEFIRTLVKQVDSNSVANIAQQLSSQWLAIRLDMIGAFISFFVAFIAATTNGFIPAGFFAIGLMYSLQITTLLKFLVRMLAMGEAQMNAVERLRYYDSNLEKEGGLDSEMSAEDVPKDWPSKGVIDAERISMRYREGPLVLDDVSFNVSSCDKVGIAGRTGSGKSSLINALYRIVEMETGRLSIDGIDIAAVPLSVLRTKLGIIPQEAVMFSFTIRFNLDPSEAFTDIELWDVLESLNLKDFVMSLPLKLEQYVTEGGDNFSAGQRQLICIARALLRKPKVLVLDEATASIDNETDTIVQKVVKEQFQNCTVLTIAHRLHTIIDSSVVMTLENGKLMEFGTPADLLAKEEGLFKGLWEKHQSSHAGHSGSSPDLTSLAPIDEE